MSGFHDIERLMHHFLEMENGPVGCAVSISQGEETLFEKSYGYADCEKSKPLTLDAVYRQFSTTKVIAALCGLIQYERGYFLLNDPVSDYLPEYKHMQVQVPRPDGGWDLVESKEPILMRHAFSMGVGMLAHDDSPAALEMQRIRAEMGGSKLCNKYDHLTEIRAFGAVPMLWEPGTHWQYGQGLDIMAAVVEATSGMGLGDFMKKNIFDPLGMKDTAYRFTESMKERLVDCTVRNEQGELAAYPTGEMDRCCQPDAIYECAATGLLSTVPDYAKFAKMLANGGKLGDVEIVGRKSIDLLRRNQLTDAQLAEFRSNSYMAGYGYGLGVRTKMDPAAGGSNGAMGEFGWSGLLGTWVSIDPEEKTSIVYMHQNWPNHEEYTHLRLRAAANGLFR